MIMVMLVGAGGFTIILIHLIRPRHFEAEPIRRPIRLYNAPVKLGHAL